MPPPAMQPPLWLAILIPTSQFCYKCSPAQQPRGAVAVSSGAAPAAAPVAAPVRPADPANAVPDWVCAVSGFCSAVSLIWCITWLFMAVSMDSRTLSKLLDDDLFLFIATTLLPLTCVLSIERRFTFSRMTHTERGNVTLGLARVVGVATTLAFMKLRYFSTQS